MDETNTLYALQPGDIFTTTIDACSCDNQLFSMVGSLLEIIGLEKVRLRKIIRLFEFRFSIPRLRKTWCITFLFKGETRGKWEGEYAGELPDSTEITMYSCSKCHKYIDSFDLPPKYHFCPNCGAKMEVTKSFINLDLTEDQVILISSAVPKEEATDG